MCKIIKTVVLSLLPFLIQSQELTITPVPISADRSFTNIVGMCQDTFGFLWLADNYNGLYRYDGDQLVSYKSNPANPNSLISDNLECLYAGAEGNIWIGSYQEGLDYFDPEAGTFLHFQHSESDPNSLCSNSIGALLEDQSGTLWVGTYRGLDTLHRQTGKFTHIEDQTEAGMALSQAPVRVLYEDKAGTIWIGCGNPFGNVPRDSLLGGLYKFEKSSGKITRYRHDPHNLTSLIDNRVRAIYEDSKGGFWVGTAGDGLHIMNREAGTFRRCRYDPGNPHNLSRPPVKTDALYAADHITFIDEDKQGHIWIGTYAAGINRYDPTTNSMEHMGTSPSAAIGLERDDFWDIFKTHDHILWVSGWEPETEDQVLYKISTLANQLNYSPTGKEVLSFAEDNEGQIWLGTDQGLDRENQGEIHFPDSQADISNLFVLNLESDSRDNLWLSTLRGLYYFNRAENTFTGYRREGTNPNTISSDAVYGTQLDEAAMIWIATRQGLDLLNTGTGDMKHYYHRSGESGSLNHNWIIALAKDASGNIWVGNLKGLNLYHPETDKFSNALDLNGAAVLTIFEDDGNRVWVGTYRAGLHYYNPQKEDFDLINDSTGLITNNLLIRGITEDRDHQMWLNTDIGLIRFNPETGNAVLIGRSRNMDPEMNSSRIFTSRTGKIFIGNKSGYYHFRPRELNPETSTSPKPYISNIFLGNKKLNPGIDKVLPFPISQTRKIVLDHRQNHFAFEFNSIDFITLESEKNLLYQLENYDDGWIKASEEKKVYYHNIAPGKYAFRVKSANLYGNWGEKKIDIIVNPPWWNAWWFRLALVICAVAAIVSLIRWRNEKLKKQLAHSEKEKQWAELEQQKTKLEMDLLRTQMNPHFIFNSLNSINRFILQNDKKLASAYLTKFSRLVRLILQNSQSSLITLDSELESVRLYLELEVVRFNHHFEYHIELPEDCEIDIIKVPPLIIQPFVENAIWHGLMHKSEKGKVDIEVAEEKDHLLIRITDDGIGREAAAMRSKSAKGHKSMGHRITADRIAKLHSSNGSESRVSVVDLVHEDGTGAGTKVTIQIPMMYD